MQRLCYEEVRPDFSNYDEKHTLYDSSRKNAVGYLKNEVPKCEIQKFAGVRSKTYAFVTKANKLENRAKGVKKSYKKYLKRKRNVFSVIICTSKFTIKTVDHFLRIFISRRM